tara:strand:+ start:851 stop:1039 length:189 start_codon:yes stop_codon:yes gene_type:complete
MIEEYQLVALLLGALAISGVAIGFGAIEVRNLRRLTNDNSLLTALLSFDFRGIGSSRRASKP